MIRYYFYIWSRLDGREDKMLALFSEGYEFDFRPQWMCYFI